MFHVSARSALRPNTAVITARALNRKHSPSSNAAAATVHANRTERMLD